MTLTFTVTIEPETYEGAPALSTDGSFEFKPMLAAISNVMPRHSKVTVTFNGNKYRMHGQSPGRVLDVRPVEPEKKAE